MNKWQVQQAFWSGFGVPAYAVGTVPENAIFPYITYEAVTAGFEYPIVLTGHIWDRSMSWERISLISERIEQFVKSMSGSTYKLDSGRLTIYEADTPISRRVSDEELDIRHIVMNVGVEFLTKF